MSRSRHDAKSTSLYSALATARPAKGLHVRASASADRGVRTIRRALSETVAGWLAVMVVTPLAYRGVEMPLRRRRKCPTGGPGSVIVGKPDSTTERGRISYPPG